MNDFDKIFKEKFDNFSEMPPAKVFENVKSNYPKPSRAKFYVGAAVAVVAVVAIIASLLPSKSGQTQVSENPSIPSAVLTESKTENTAISVDQNISSSENTSQIKTENFISENFNNHKVTSNLRDTAICGNELFVDGLTASEVKCSKDLNLRKSASGVSFYSEKYGSHKIYLIDGKLIVDSATVVFQKSENTEVSLSKENLCYGESVVLATSDKVSSISWNDADYQVNKISDKRYELSRFAQGAHIVQICIGEGVCAMQRTFKVNVAPLPKISVSTVAASCKNNGSFDIDIENEQLNFCKLNSETSRNGHFGNLSAGTYSVEINYANSCTTSQKVVVENKSKMEAAFQTVRSNYDLFDYEFRNQSRIDASGDVSYEWLVNGEMLSNDYNFDHKFAKSGTYKVELRVKSSSCTSASSQTINISASKFYVPNIFTPNGDGIGDLFEVSYDGELRDYNLSVYTQAGQLLYRSTEIGQSWDGKISGNNDAAEGTYFYVITATDENGETVNSKGTVLLKR
ncbi:MAG: gliding motility-associated C-terminal domain-containing protein [Bacteroidales bacterium]|nr:gliding motility-associated C-terminal domain-containing protein [Bacteroidales bacterium]